MGKREIMKSPKMDKRAKKSDKAKRNFELCGKHTARHVRAQEALCESRGKKLISAAAPVSCPNKTTNVSQHSH